MRFGLVWVAFFLLSVPLVAQETPPQPASSAAAPVWLDDLDAAFTQAQREGKPVLVRFQATYSEDCRQLAAEMEKPGVQEELRRWTCVAMDVVRSPSPARRWSVQIVPAMRILTPRGQFVAMKDGAVEAEDLVAWLDEHYATARSALDDALTATGAIDAMTVATLVRQFGQRDPVLRDAAVRRLQPHAALAAPAVVDEFRKGNLGVRLAAYELLLAWRAPVEEIDPWQPETLTTERLDALAAWSRAPSAGAPKPAPLTAEALAEAERAVDRMLAAEPAEARAMREQLARYGEALLPAVYRRLEAVETDDARQRLLALRYRLVATDSMVLRWPGGLERLAAQDPAVRQKAAEELSKLARDEDRSLLLELFSDADPLVREIGLRGLQQAGGKAGLAALVRLLNDPSANVRAAVLKQLAQSPSPGMVPAVARYLQQEKDPDLAVYSIRFLEAAGGEEAAKALLPLLMHESWQVRAQAAEALGKAGGEFGDSPLSPATQADILAGMIRLLDDPDPFVVSRALGGIDELPEGMAVDPLERAAERHPSLAPQIIPLLVNHGDQGAALVLLRNYLKSEDPAVRKVAFENLGQTTEGPRLEDLVAGLQDPVSAVRIAAADAALAQLSGLLQSDSDGADGSPAMKEPLTPILAKMLQSEEAEERVAAGVLLVALSEAEPALTVVLDAVKAEPAIVQRAAHVLRWVPDGERETVFRQLRERASDHSAASSLIEQLLLTPGPGTVGVIWELFHTDTIDPGLLATAYRGLIQAYLGDSFYSRSEWNATGVAKLIEDAGQRARNGSPIERNAALHLLALVDPPAAGVIAAELCQDAALSQEVRDAAFGVLLGTVPEKPALEAALGALGSEGPRRAAALEYLVSGGQGFLTFASFSPSDYVYSDTPIGPPQPSWLAEQTAGAPIIPAAPPGLSAEQLRPLLEASDPRQAAQAGYLLALLGDAGGMEKLIAYWTDDPFRGSAEPVSRLVYRAVAVLDDSSRVDVLRRMYDDGRIEDVPDFYWTIRIMSGRDVLLLRKRIRDELGAAALK